jgi:hypothetical protein
MSEPNRDELVSILKDLQQKVNTVVEKTNANSSGPVEATNSVEIETPAETVEEPVAETVPEPVAETVPEPVAAVDTVMAGGKRKRRRTKRQGRTKKQCGGRRKTKGRKGKGRSRKH